MVAPKPLKSQMIAKKKELVSRLQQEAGLVFFDRMMYDINDSLTSILAVCELEPKDSILKIKQYIHRINQSLQGTKIYRCMHENQKFSISMVLRNMIHVIRVNYSEVNIVPLLADIKAFVKGDWRKFEKLLFSIFIGLFAHDRAPCEISIDLRQKDKDAMITIVRDGFSFSDEDREIIREASEDAGLSGNVHISLRGNGAEVILRIPLIFNAVIFSDSIIKTHQSQTSPEKFAG